MGYACPVCGDPQADAGHLANHLAFTAILGDDDHERWLDEHTPGWGQEGEDELAERVVEHAEAVEFPQVFEDTTGNDAREGHDHEHADARGHQPGDVPGARGRGRQGGPSDPEVQRVLAEAREMTREMFDAGEGGSDDPAEAPGGDAGDGEGGDGDDRDGAGGNG